MFGKPPSLIIDVALDRVGEVSLGGGTLEGGVGLGQALLDILHEKNLSCIFVEY